MLFTIAIPTYNNAKTVSKAIESAINQDYKDEYEVLIVNNASTDNTQEVISKYKENPKVRIVTNDKTVDLFANHNVCFEKAKGDYVIFCHSDDVLFSNALILINDRLKLRQYPPKYIIWGRSMFRDYYLLSLRNVNQNLNETFGGEFAICCFLGGGLTPSGTCYSRKAILEIGGFPPMKSRWTPLDWYILLWASFNCFEFEMIDRMLFKRLDASTAVEGLSQDRVNTNLKEMLDILYLTINESQKKKMLYLVYSYAPDFLIQAHKPYFSKSQWFKLKIKRLVRRII